MASIDELWLVDFGDPYPGEPAARRPALILGPPNSFGSNFPFVLVAPLTTVNRGLSLHIEVEANSDSGLDSVSYVQCELLRSVNAKRLVHRIGSVDIEASAAAATTIRTLLSL